MKILFVYTDINVRGGAQSYQFGIGQVSAMLRKHGHTTRLQYMFASCDTAPLLETIKDFKPDLLAFSAVSPQFNYVSKVLESLPEDRPLTLLGGQHATLCPQCLEETPNLDIICIGEGEYPTLELIEAIRDDKPIDNIHNLWIKKDGSIIQNKTRPFIEDLDELPFPDRELFDTQAIIDSDFKTVLFMFSRGCPYKCTFCSNHALRKKQDGTYVRFRSVESCLQEIRKVTNKYDVDALYFNDDCFTVSKDFVKEFCKRYKTEFKYPFDINARPESLSDEICEMLSAAGCRRVSIGIECGHEQFRKDVLKRPMTNDRIREAFDSCRKNGLKTKSFNIVGFPGETAEIFKETIKLNAEIQPDSVIIGVFEPYPGTELADVCINEKYIDPARAKDSFIGRTDTVLNMPAFPREEILKCFRSFAYNVYKDKNPKKAILMRIYYSQYGQMILKLLTPFRNVLRKIGMGM